MKRSGLCNQGAAGDNARGRRCAYRGGYRSHGRERESAGQTPRGVSRINLASNDAEAQEVEFRQQVGPALLGGNGEQKEACAGQESRVKESWILTPMIVKAIPFS